MCRKPDEIRLEIIDSTHVHPDAAQAIVDAWKHAIDTACCGTRTNAIHLAVADTAARYNLNVAWADILNTDGPHYYLWPRDTIRRHTVNQILEQNNALKITDLAMRSMRDTLARANTHDVNA